MKAIRRYLMKQHGCKNARKWGKTLPYTEIQLFCSYHGGILRKFIVWTIWSIFSKKVNRKFTGRLITWSIEPKANRAFEQLSKIFDTSNSLSNAFLLSLMRRYNTPISVRTSTFSVVILCVFQKRKKEWKGSSEQSHIVCIDRNQKN